MTMYSKYFGFSDLPFTIAPDPRYLYLSEQHREALASLLYGINCNGGFVLLTGDVGTGKTTVCRCLLEQLPASTEVAFILNPKYGISELLEAICDELKIDYRHSQSKIKGYIDGLNAHLLEAHGRGINTVLIIDEAQNLSNEVLEQIRLLTNLETSSQKLLQIILIGQPELLDKLARPELRQLNQRITARYHLKALSRSDLAAYVSHRLAISGSEAALFTRLALWRLHRLTRGVPRMVNIICDRALLGAYVERRPRVGGWLLMRAAHEVLGHSPTQAPATRWRLALLTLTLAVLLLWAAGYPGGFSRELFAQAQSSAAPSMAIPAAPAAQALALATPPTTPAPLPSPPVTDPPASAFETPAPALVTPPLVSTEPVAAPSPVPPSSPGLWHWPQGTDLVATEVLAYQALFRLWGIEYDPASAPVICQFARLHRLGCLLQPVDLDELLKLNQPAVINLFNEAGQSFFATLFAVDREQGLARLNIAGEVRQVELAELRRWLQHNQLLLWRTPPGYQAPLRPEARSPLVPWLEAQLAGLQGRALQAPHNEYYDQALQLQVLAFQHHYQLVTDAVVGPQTLIQLSALSDADIPLLTVVEPGE
ncbi:MAG: AAA family ATPase [Pseudomonas sp.]|uniref:ExeA family protein n=1 Tax=Pseudomonas sp. TaxID=306 RepID=UPI003BB7F261